MEKLLQIADPLSDDHFLVHVFWDGTTAWWRIDHRDGTATFLEPVGQDADNELDT